MFYIQYFHSQITFLYPLKIRVRICHSIESTQKEGAKYNIETEQGTLVPTIREELI